MDLYQYSCFHEEITLKSGNYPHTNKTNKVHICTFTAFDEQKLIWDMLQAEYEEGRKREKCQRKEGNNRQDDRKHRQTFRV